MSGIKNFLSFVEIRTKLCSFIPFFIGIAYALYQYGTGSFDLAYTGIFIVAMFFFDMSVTGINNHIGKREEGVRRHYSDGVGLAIIVSFIAFAAVLGVVMTLKYGIILLACGGICFLVGIFYTFGPISISRTPYGELLSGLVQGFFITFMIVFINAPEGALAGVEFFHEGGAAFVFGADSLLEFGVARLWVNFFGMVKITLATIPSMLGIAGIMLANNICDVPDDVKVRRYTLPYYIGIPAALRLFSGLYHAAFLVIILSVAVGVASPICLLVLPLYPVIRRHIKAFQAVQKKPDTFGFAVGNFIMICSAYAATMFIGWLVGWHLW